MRDQMRRYPFSRRSFLAAAAALALVGCGSTAATPVPKAAEEDDHAPAKGTPAKDAAAKVSAATDAKKRDSDGKEPAAGIKDLAPSFGPTYVMANKIVTLADPGGSRFCRFSVAIEFKPHGTDESNASTSGNQLALYVPETDDAEYQEVTGGKVDPEKEFLASIKKYVPAMEDAVVTTISSRTAAELSTAAGRENAKIEIAIRVQRLFGTAEQVTNVYFTDFIVQ